MRKKKENLKRRDKYFDNLFLKITVSRDGSRIWHYQETWSTKRVTWIYQKVIWLTNKIRISIYFISFCVKYYPYMNLFTYLNYIHLYHQDVVITFLWKAFLVVQEWKTFCHKSLNFIGHKLCPPCFNLVTPLVPLYFVIFNLCEFCNFCIVAVNYICL